MAISEYMVKLLDQPSSIRNIFEKAGELAAEYGAGAVYDFSIGNPDLKPPEEFYTALVREAGARGDRVHGYMPNAGFPEVRRAVARFVSRQEQVDLDAGYIIMTCGAAGGLNIALKTLINRGDEVIVISPCFMEYTFYIENHGGVPVIVPSGEDFSIDTVAVAKAVNEKTACIIINSPNNPTGKVYSPVNLKDLAVVLEEAERRNHRPIYLISDEPYRPITYDGVQAPPIFGIFRNSIIVNSYSKSLSIPGERIGWAAVHPGADDAEDLCAGLAVSNRILGFVNAPALMQRVLPFCLEAAVNVSRYARRRDRLHGCLTDMGYNVRKPEGGFYFFIRAPEGYDEAPIVEALREERILVVPGGFFYRPGYFRVSYCVADAVIEGSLPGFRRALVRTAGKSRQPAVKD